MTKCNYHTLGGCGGPAFEWARPSDDKVFWYCELHLDMRLAREAEDIERMRNAHEEERRANTDGPWHA